MQPLKYHVFNVTHTLQALQHYLTGLGLLDVSQFIYKNDVLNLFDSLILMFV